MTSHPMDTDYEYPIHGWTATNHYNETLDLFHHRWQTRRDAQEIFLEENILFLEAEADRPQQQQGQIVVATAAAVVAGFVSRDDAQVAASWNSLWDEEEDSDDDSGFDEEGGMSFWYYLSPEKVCSMETITSCEETVVSFSFVEDEGGREFPSIGECANQAMPSPLSSQTIPGPSSPSQTVKFEKPDDDQNIDQPDRERSDLASLNLDRRPFAAHDRDAAQTEKLIDKSTDKPKHGTRWEPIRVMLGNWEVEYDVIKPYADYTDVPSPIILPGSPPQRTPKPSLSRVYKVPTVRDAFEDYLESRRNRNVKEPSPAAPPLPFPEQSTRQNLTRNPNQSQSLRPYRPQRSNSDISSLDLGDPLQPLDATHLAGEFNTVLSLSSPRGMGAATSTSVSRSLMPPPPLTLSTSLPAQGGLRARRGFIGPNRLSIQIPHNNFAGGRSSSGSPQSKETASTASSLGATFQLDEELDGGGFFRPPTQR